MKSSTVKALALVGGLNILFAGQAQGAPDPILFEPSMNPFAQTVHGCTADGALMEVRFSFDVSPYYAAGHINEPQDVDQLAAEIEAHVEDVLMPLWQGILEDMNFTDIESGEAKPLKPLLDALYEFTDGRFNDVRVHEEADNILPVLRGGAYDVDHSFCLD